MSGGTRPAAAVPAGPAAGTRRRGPRRTPVVLTVGAVLLAAAVVVLVVAIGSRASSGPGATVVVIGDSYSSGTALGGLGETNWTARLAAAREWQLTDTAIPGTGYVRTRPYAGAYAAAQLDRALAADPDVVIVEGSLNDGDLPAAQVGAAAAALYAAVADRAPTARLVVIGPAWPVDGPPSPGVLAVRDATGAAARAAGALWIDPIAEQWFAGGQRAGLIGADALHPTDAGHRLMAERTDDDLTRLGL